MIGNSIGLSSHWHGREIEKLQHPTMATLFLSSTPTIFKSPSQSPPHLLFFRYSFFSLLYPLICFVIFILWELYLCKLTLNFGFQKSDKFPCFPEKMQIKIRNCCVFLPFSNTHFRIWGLQEGFIALWLIYFHDLDFPC